MPCASDASLASPTSRDSTYAMRTAHTKNPEQVGAVWLIKL